MRIDGRRSDGSADGASEGPTPVCLELGAGSGEAPEGVGLASYTEKSVLNVRHFQDRNFSQGGKHV